MTSPDPEGIACLKCGTPGVIHHYDCAPDPIAATQHDDDRGLFDLLDDGEPA